MQMGLAWTAGLRHSRLSKAVWCGTCRMCQLTAVAAALLTSKLAAVYLGSQVLSGFDLQRRLLLAGCKSLQQHSHVAHGFVVLLCKLRLALPGLEGSVTLDSATTAAADCLPWSASAGLSSAGLPAAALGSRPGCGEAELLTSSVPFSSAPGRAACGLAGHAVTAAAGLCAAPGLLHALATQPAAKPSRGRTR